MNAATTLTTSTTAVRGVAADRPSVGRSPADDSSRRAGLWIVGGLAAAATVVTIAAGVHLTADQPAFAGGTGTATQSSSVVDRHESAHGTRGGLRSGLGTSLAAEAADPREVAHGGPGSIQVARTDRIAAPNAKLAIVLR